MSNVIYVNEVVVRGNNIKLVTINQNAEETKALSVSKVHHILLLDRSHSMSSDIDELMDDVKVALNSIGEDDLISIIWFSGPGQYETVIKAAKKDENLGRLLDMLKSTVGNTCFSEPLEEALRIVTSETVKSLCPNFSVTLFTDGHPVAPWSQEEEKTRIESIVKEMGGQVIAVNTIGYGMHYNQQLLLDIANQSSYGVFNHSSRINDYSELFGHNYLRISNLNLGNISVSAKDAKILYLGDKNTMLYCENMNLDFLSKRRNQVFILGTGTDDFDFEYNGTTYNTAELKSPRLLPTTMRNFYYALAYNLYYQGNREDALGILVENLGDKGLADTHLTAFTYDEVEKQSVKIRKAIFKTKYRFTGGTCSSDYLPKADATCVMDVLRILGSGNNIYIAPVGPGKRYKRIGKKVIDVFGTISRAEGEQRSLFAQNMQMNEEKMNISYRVERPINVHLNPKSANRVGLPETIRAKDYRSYSIIKDGALNQTEIEALVQIDTFEELRSLGVPMMVIADEQVNEGFAVVNEMMKRVTITLSSLPIINKMYTETGIREVLQSVKKVKEAEIAQKVLNSFVDEMSRMVSTVGAGGGTGNGGTSQATGYFRKLTPDQITVLEEHGINNRFVYKPIKVKTEESGEMYEARTLNFDLKDFATLPKVGDVMVKMVSKKPLTRSQERMAEYISHIRGVAAEKGLSLADANSLSFVQSELMKVKDTLMKERMYLNVVKMGRILTGGWFEDLQADGKGNYVYADAESPHVLVVKPKRTLVAI